MKYPFCFQKNNQGYLVTVPDLTGCEITCKNISTGFDEVKQAIADHLKILAEYGEQIPQAKTIEAHQVTFPDCIWAMIDIDISPYLGKSHKINVTLPELLIKQIDDRVNKFEQYKTRSGFIASACINELNKY